MRNINIRNLFIVACVLKVASALAGWYFNSPWILGFVAPLLVMIGYMFLGITRRNNQVSDEKFADSCYYLGFIFTIASISVALMDLPNIGTNIQDIAVRFGAAMLSTVLGLSVRVAMVTFRKDMGDAIQEAEESVVEASLRLRDQLVAALDRLNSFEVAVDQAARLSVERVNLQVENLSKNHADRLTEFFTTLTASNQQVFTSALDEVKGASMRLSNSVNEYAQGMNSSLGSIEKKVVAFSDAITERLKNTTFPDDHFVKQLEYPLGRLKSAADEISEHIVGASETVGESAMALSVALKKFRGKTSATEAALDAVTQLAAQQQLLMDGAEGQIDRIERLGSTLQGLDGTFKSALQGFESAKSSDTELKNAVRSVVADSEAVRKEVRDRLMDVARELVTASESQYQNFDQARLALQTAAQTYSTFAMRMETATEAVAGKLLESTNANIQAAARLATSTAATEVAVGKLESATASDSQVAQTLSALDETASSGLKRVDAAIEQLQLIARYLSEIETLGVGVGLKSEIRSLSSEPSSAAVSYSIPEPVTMLQAITPSLEAADGLDVSPVPSLTNGASVVHRPPNGI